MRFFRAVVMLFCFSGQRWSQKKKGTPIFISCLLSFLKNKKRTPIFISSTPPKRDKKRTPIFISSTPARKPRKRKGHPSLSPVFYPFLKKTRTPIFISCLLSFLMKSWNVNATKKKKRTSILSLNSKHSSYFTTGALAEGIKKSLMQ